MRSLFSPSANAHAWGHREWRNACGVRTCLRLARKALYNRNAWLFLVEVNQKPHRLDSGRKSRAAMGILPFSDHRSTWDHSKHAPPGIWLGLCGICGTCVHKPETPGFFLFLSLFKGQDYSPHSLARQRLHKSWWWTKPTCLGRVEREKYLILSYTEVSIVYSDC